MNAIADKQFAEMMSIRMQAVRRGLIEADDSLLKNEAQTRLGLSHILSLEDTPELVKKGVTSATALPQLDDDQIKIIAELYGISWFGRVWPVQEVILSRQKVVHYGNLEIDWLDIGWFARWLVHKYRQVDLSSSQEKGIKEAMWVHDQGLLYSGGFPLATMLRTCRQFDAENPKDMIYATYGMVDFNLSSIGEQFDSTRTQVNTVPAEIQPDYAQSKTYEDVYYDLTNYLLHKEENLGILTAVGPEWPSECGRTFQHASWIPRWNRQQEIIQPT